MPDNINTAMINTVKETIKSSSIWNKLVKTIENANINMDKLIQDSVEYGIEIGMFQQNKDGIIECKEKRTNNLQSNDKFTSPLRQKNFSNEEINQHTQTRSTPKSDSETTLSAYSSSKSNITRTRKNTIEKDFKRTSDMSTEIISNKQLKTTDDCHVKNNTFIDSPKSKSSDQKVSKSKVKLNCKKMVRPIPICAFCLGDEALNKRTKKQENMITCWDCGTCGHPTCLQWPDSLFQKVRTIRWQCLQCKRCSYCGMISKKDDDMLLCDVCDQGFHTYCCDPPIKSLPKGEWVCRICRPVPGRKEKPSIFQPDDYDFKPDCQIITPETVKEMCNLTPKLNNNVHNTNNVNGKLTKFNMKIKSKLSRKSTKVNLLQLKKKKLVNKAVLRQRQALTDGLSKFFTPSNKRQSRVSKQSISSDSFEKDSKKSPLILSPKDKSSNRSVVSSTRSKSPGTVDVMEESNHSQDITKSSSNRKKSSGKKLSKVSEISHSLKRTNSAIETKIKKLKMKKMKMSVKSKVKAEHSTIRGPGRPKLQETLGKTSSNTLDKCINGTESSSVTMSKNDQSTNYSIMSADNCDADPYPICDIDRQWYTDIQQKVVELLPPPVDAAPQLQPLNKVVTSIRGHNENSEPPELSMEIGNCTDGDHSSHTGSVVQRFPPRIQIGRYIIDTWYSAPYPSEYARLNVLYICEYCLKPIKSYDVFVMHMEKCTSYFPPGNEIYRSGELSVFEIDGYVSKLYCQQLCLLAKLFLDHKTLYYDVEPFLFYVAVISKNKSSHIIGYFSKEKRSTHKYNLSCIMVLPPYQKFNYGRFLIDFSYLLSRKEGQYGSPEKPLSTLGRISYESYWKSKILPFILNKDDVTVEFYARQKIYKPSKGLAVTIDRVSTETGISPHDVASTIQMLSKKVDLDNSDRISIQFDWEKLKSAAEKYASRYPKWIPIDEDCLRWAPLINPNDRQFNIKSPTKVSNNSNNVSSPEMDKNSSRKSTTTDTNACQTTTVDNNISGSPKENSKADRNCKSGIEKISKPKQGSLKNAKSIKSSPNLKKNIKPKLPTVSKKEKKKNQSENIKKKRAPENRDQIVTRNRSNKQNSSLSSNIEDVSPIKVDLTKESSENSDNQDDCIEISSTLPSPKKGDHLWTNKLPVFEIFKEVNSTPTGGLSPPKESPPINRNDPSPVPMVQNEIIGPVIDEETEEENDIEKWDIKQQQQQQKQQKPQNGNLSPRKDTIDLSNDPVVEDFEEAQRKEANEPPIDWQDSVIDKKDDIGTEAAEQDKVVEVVLNCDIITTIDSSFSSVTTTESLQSDKNLLSKNSEIVSEPSKVKEFIFPAAIIVATATGTTIKDLSVVPISGDDCDKPPTLSRISSQEESNHFDDSTSFNLPADISQNEEFKNFYNDGNVFNSITTSQTDSSDKDADESLLSVSNSNSYGISDVELNGAYSCDSSICYNLRPRVRASKSDLDLFENHLRCSPGQSDRVQNHVSSTTPFVSPSVMGQKNHPLGNINTEITAMDSPKCEITFEDVGFVDNNESTFERVQHCYLVSAKETMNNIRIGHEKDDNEIDNNNDIETGNDNEDEDDDIDDDNDVNNDDDDDENDGEVSDNNVSDDIRKQVEVPFSKTIDETRSTESSNQINIGIVSSSLNETNVISDSSL